MRRGLLALLCVAAAPVYADPMPSAPPVVIGYGALPGGVVAETAELLPKGSFAVGTLDGVGTRKGMIAAGDSMLRVMGDLAVAYGVTSFLSVALSFDGRYDRHTGDNPSPDDGYVGDPHLLVRASWPVGSARLGAQIGAWAPGRNAPSLVGAAISVDFRALLSLPIGPTTLSLEVGYRIDDSAKSVSDPSALSLADRTSLGASDWNEILAGANLTVPLGRKLWLDGELTLDAYPGAGHNANAAGHPALDDGTLTIRGGVSAGYHFTDRWSALVFVQLAKSPYATASQVAAEEVPLVPYEPAWLAGIGISGRFGGPRHASTTVKDCAYTPEGCPVVAVPILADIAGTVVDGAGKPVVGAKVAIVLKDVTAAPVATDETGAYAFKGVRIGESAPASGGKPARHDITETSAELHVAVDGKKPGTATLSPIAEGANTVPPITLDPELPPGQLRGVVHSLPNGKPVTGAKITVEPGHLAVESKPDGTFQLDLAPGSYTITVKAPGFAEQQLNVTIDPNGVAIKNIDLHQ